MKLNKKQKRTATIASMAALLAVVLGMGGQTFAKYITTNTTEAQTATVAKWGLVLNQKNETDAIFSDSYKNGDDTTTVDADDAVVAPGTSGTITYVIDGTAEVDAMITFSFVNYDPVELKFTPTGGTTVTYQPIVWTVNGDVIDPATWKLEKKDYKANTTAKSYEIVIGWSWDFSDAAQGVTSTNDTYDTILGGITSIKNGAFEGNYTDTEGRFGTKDTMYTVDNTLSFSLKAVIEQVD